MARSQRRHVEESEITTKLISLWHSYSILESRKWAAAVAVKEVEEEEEKEECAVTLSKL